MKNKDYSFSKLHAEAFTCIQCGYCRRVCPVYQKIGRESATPRNKVYQLQNLLSSYPPFANIPPEFAERFWQCTHCRRCVDVCPAHMDLMNLWQGVKHQLAKRGAVPKQIMATKQRIKEHGNIFANPNEVRSYWALSLPGYPEVLRPQDPEIAVFVGCVASFYPLLVTIPLAFAQIMLKLGIKAYFLGADEYCCGHPLITAGEVAVSREVARKNLAKIRELGLEKLVFLCPSCLSSWHEDYPVYNQGELGITLVHYTEYLADLIREGRLQFAPYPHRTTYHDPCDLGRHLGIYDPPRRILQSIPELEFVELANNRADSLCCGGGASLHMIDQELALGIRHARLEQIKASGVETVVTACGECRQVLTFGLQDVKSAIRVLDIAELAAELVVN